MRIVLQRVHRAAVTVEGSVTGRIDQGLLALVGVGHDSTDADAAWLAAKVEALRVAGRLYQVFCDALTVPVGRGVFGAHMDIEMVCDGPVTLSLQSEGR